MSDLLNSLLNPASTTGAFVFKGSITIASDFPTLLAVQNGWTYTIESDVIDNDASKTNTGESFLLGDIISWNGSVWTDITGIELFVKVGGDIKPITDGDNLNMLTGGFKDFFVTTAIKLGETAETAFSTIKKSIVGAINELLGYVFPSQTVTVAKDGTGQFDDIQDAIDSVTDATNTKRYTIKINPGDYSGDIVGKNFVSLVGVASNTVRVIDGSYTTAAYYSGIKSMAFINIISGGAKTIIDATAGNGIADSIVNFENVEFQATILDNASSAKILDADCNTLILEQYSIVYVDISTGAKVPGNNSLIDIKGTGTALLTAAFTFVQSGQLDSDFNIFNVSDTTNFSISNTECKIFFVNASYSGTVTSFNFTGTGQYEIISNQYILTGAGSGLGSSIILDNGAGKVTANGSTLLVSSFATNCYSDAVNVGDTIDISFCTIDETNIACGAGTINKVARQDSIFAVNTDIVDENIPIGDATIRSLQDIFNNGFNAGWASGQEISEPGTPDGTVSITDGTGLIRTSDDEQAPLRTFDIVAFNNISLTDNSDNYIYIDYNSGDPTLLVTTSGTAILENENDQYEIYEIYREGTALHITDHRQRSKNVGSKIQQFLYSILKIWRANGLILGESADTNRNVEMSSGKVWVKLNKLIISSIDTSGSDTFDRYYQNPLATWIKTTGNTTWDNLQYNDVTTGLVSLGVSKYSFQDFWVEADGDILSVYAVAQYNSLVGAELAPVVIAPPRTDDHALYIGRIVFQQADTTAQSVLSPFTGQVLSGSSVTNHASLSSLDWTSSGHSGTISNLAGFGGAGAADEYALSTFIRTTGIQSIDVGTSGTFTFEGDGGLPVFKFKNNDTITSNGNVSIDIERPTGSDGECSLNFITGTSLSWKIGMDNAPAGELNDFGIKRTNNAVSDLSIDATDGTVKITENLIISGGVSLTDKKLEIQCGDGDGVAIAVTDEGAASFRIQDNESSSEYGQLRYLTGADILALETSGTLYAQSIYASTTANAANVYVNSSGLLSRSTSSERYKENIIDIEIDTSKIYSLRPVSFNSKDQEDNKRYSGLIAEEVYEQIPEAVLLNEEEQPDALDWNIITACMLKEIQALKAKNDDLEARIIALETV